MCFFRSFSVQCHTQNAVAHRRPWSSTLLVLSEVPGPRDCNCRGTGSSSRLGEIENLYQATAGLSAQLRFLGGLYLLRTPTTPSSVRASVLLLWPHPLWS